MQNDFKTPLCEIRSAPAPPAHASPTNSSSPVPKTLNPLHLLYFSPVPRTLEPPLHLLIYLSRTQQPKPSGRCQRVRKAHQWLLSGPSTRFWYTCYPFRWIPIAISPRHPGGKKTSRLYVDGRWCRRGGGTNSRASSWGARSTLPTGSSPSSSLLLSSLELSDTKVYEP